MTAATLAPSTSPAPPSPLPVIETAVEAYTSILTNPKVAARLVGTWLAISIAVPAVLYALFSQSSGMAMIAIPAVMMVLLILAMLSIAVGWHRFLLLGEQPSTIYLALNAHVVRYFVGALILAVVAWLVMMVAMLAFAPLLMAAQHSTVVAVLASVLAVAAYVGFAFVMWRAALILPSRAIGEPLAIGQALEVTQGNAIRLGLATLAVSVPIVVLAVVSNVLEAMVSSPVATVAFAGVSMLVTAISALAGVSVLSIMYRFFKSGR